MPENDTPAVGGGKKLETVTLKKEHKHRGEKHQPGDKIDVRPDQKKRLEDRGKI